MYRPSDISRNACFSLWSQKSRLALDSKKMASISPRQLAKSATSSALCIFTNGTLKEATVRRYHYDGHHQLRQHMQIFLDAYNFAKRLRTLNGLTPFESVCKAWRKEPNRFKYDPVQLTLGLHT